MALLLAGCAIPDYAAVRGWAATAADATDQRPTVEAPRRDDILALQSVLDVYFAALERIAGDGIIRFAREDFTAAAAQAAAIDPPAGDAVTALAEVLFTAGNGIWRAPQTASLITAADPPVQVLLRTLAGVYETVGGRLEVEGLIGSLIDPSAGMDQESTGRENIVLRGLFRGLSEAASESMADEVGAFSGIGEFLDVPVRTYSAGMQVRLSFAMATVMEPEVLLMDEWFLAGDAAFMDKAREKLTRLVTGAEILVLATHDMGIVREWCTRAIRLDAGRIVADGPVAEVLGPD